VLTPAPPTEYEGLRALFEIRIADQIHVMEEDIGRVYQRAGGELVSDDGDQVTFRFVELRGASSGRAAGTVVSSSGAEAASRDL
jgi:hypothetical protein